MSKQIVLLLVVLVVSVTTSTLRASTTQPTQQTQPTTTSTAHSSTTPTTQPISDLRAAYLKPQAEWPKPEVDPSVTDFRDIGLLSKPAFPADNAYTKEKADLGKQLFFDPRLSASKTVACASCHDPDLAWTDGRTVSFGHERQAGSRNAPQIMDAGYQKYLFWDGRAGSLEEQVLMPVMANNEMHSVPADVVKLIGDQPEYRAEFKTVFGDELVSMERIAKSIATFERTITAGRSKFDQFISGHAPHAMDDDAIRGMQLFRTSARCINCHDGPNFSDGKFHSLGLTYYGRKLQDLGRYNVTKKPEDMGKFRTPSLRNIGRTGPYMHNGLFELPGVINIYNAGGVTPHRTDAQKADPQFPVKDSLLQPLGLTKDEKLQLLAFLDSLTEPKFRLRPPPLPGLTMPTTQDSLPP